MRRPRRSYIVISIEETTGRSYLIVVIGLNGFGKFGYKANCWGRIPILATGPSPRLHFSLVCADSCAALSTLVM